MSTSKSKTKITAGIPVHCKYDKLVNLDKLIPNPDNPNQHPAEQIELLAKIIQENGWRDRIVVSNLSGMIVKGHGRYQAAVSAGLGRVPVEYQDYASVADEIRDLIADNKISELSEIDNDLARDLISSIDKKDFDIESFGFTIDDFGEIEDRLMGRVKGEARPEVDFTIELTESSNYVVLVFNNDIDWLQAQSVLGLNTVKALDSKEGFKKQGVGRVIDGPTAIEKMSGI